MHLMLAPLVDVGYALALEFGLPILFVLFVLKGAIVGKPFPTSVFLPGYLVAVSASSERIVLAIVVASLGYVVGQLLIYGIARQWGFESLRSAPLVTVTDEQAASADRLFSRYSGIGVVVTNLVPYVGSFIMIPAGLANYPVWRLTVFALASTLLNYVLIVWIVLGSVDLLF